MVVFTTTNGVVSTYIGWKWGNMHPELWTTCCFSAVTLRWGIIEFRDEESDITYLHAITRRIRARMWSEARVSRVYRLLLITSPALISDSLRSRRSARKKWLGILEGPQWSRTWLVSQWCHLFSKVEWEAWGNNGLFSGKGLTFVRANLKSV